MKTLGTVCEWLVDRGYGYIATDDGRRVFVGKHIVAAAGIGSELSVGARVRCSVRGAPTGGMQAARVELAPDSPTAAEEV
jgi:cold shock CspA family protein